MYYSDRDLANRFQLLAHQVGIEATAEGMGVKRTTLQNWLNNGIPQTRIQDVKRWVAERMDEREQVAR